MKVPVCQMSNSCSETENSSFTATII